MSPPTALLTAAARDGAGVACREHLTAPAVTLDPDRLAEIVAGLAAVRSWWAPHAVHDPVHRGKVRLLATEQYEVWLLGWCPGQQVDLHDHGDAAAAFEVVEGDLVELRLEHGRLARHELTLGSRRLAPRGTVHDVVNESSWPATSIHAYSPPLTSMTYYREEHATSAPRWSPDWTERVEAVDPLFDAASVARLTHPSRG